MYSNQSFNTTADELAEKKAQYEKKIKAASLAFMEEKNYVKAAQNYNEALTIANALHLGAMKECILRFMVCNCIVSESNKLEDLAEVVMTLQNISKALKERFPAVYCLLAHAHCKLYRFDLALDSLRAADDIFKRNQLLETFYIPGTTIPIEQSPKGKMWSIVEKECSIYHKPDAICASKECNHITKPYVSPNKNIYMSDPAFNGMIIVHCDNKARACVLKFHPSCWKVIKDETNLVQKVSDKDMLGVQCFTPNCMYENAICTISFIEIIGPNGEVKAQMKKSTTDSWPVNKNVSKGAIKKQRAAVGTKVTESPKFTPQKEHVPVIPKNEFKAQKKLNLYDGFDENQLLSVTTGSPNFDTKDDTPEAGEKAFIFSLFYHYIRDNLVRVCDLYNKFCEIRESLIYFKDIDILSFLLDTNVIIAMDDKDVGDMLDDLMNDDYANGVFNDATENHEKNNNNIPDEQRISNARNGNWEEEAAATGGDASSHYSVNTSIDVNQDVTENNKLEEYVASLKKEMKNLLGENSQLKKEAQEKDYKIEVFLKQMDECETLYEKMSDFKERYDEIKKENFNLKEEVIALISEKKLLEEQVAKLNDSEARRNEIKQTFEAEYKILQNCINASWEKKTEELNATLKQELEAKKSLLSQYLRTQFDANKNLLYGYIDQCASTLEVIGKLNTWMEKYMNVKQFKDNTKWMDRLNYLQKATDDLQNNFTNLFDKLDTEECPAEVRLEFPTVPEAPKESLSDIVMNALNSYYTSQYELVRNLMQKSQQQQQQINQQWQAQQLQAQQLQRSAAYNMHPYPYNAHLQQPALPYATPIHPHPAYQVARPMIGQHHYTPSPVVQNGTGIHVQKTNVEIKELSSSSENLSVKSATSSLGKLDIQNKKEESKTDTTAPIKADLKEETKTELEEPIESYFNKLSEKREQMRKALKAIALNVKEKAETDTVQDEQSKTSSDSDGVDKKIKGDDNGLQLEICDDDKSDVTSVNSKGDSPKIKKKTAGINSLIKVMQQKYPGALEADIVEIIAEIRKKNNGTLTGKPVNEILSESEEYFSRNQQIHVMRYYLKDGSKSSCSEKKESESSNKLQGSAQQTPYRDWISPSISDKFVNGTNTSSVQKKTWNIIPQEEAKWTVSGEIECSICMNFVAKRNCYTLNCRHSFHRECIKLWLKSDRSCPNCRVVVTEDDEFPPLPA